MCTDGLVCRASACRSRRLPDEHRRVARGQARWLLRDVLLPLVVPVILELYQELAALEPVNSVCHGVNHMGGGGGLGWVLVLVRV